MATKNPIKQIKLPNDNTTYDVQDNTLIGSTTVTITASAAGDRTISVSKDNANTIINLLDTGSSTPQDNDYYISQYVGGGTTTTTYHRRPMSALWAYVKSKTDSLYAASSHTHSAYVNQNAFSHVKVTVNGTATDIAADNATDTLNLSGSNVTLIPNADTDSLSIGITSANVIAALGLTPAANNHTHTLSLATDSGSSTVDLAANTVYKLTAGGQTLIFKTPADTNTWRGIQDNLTSSSNTTESLSAKQGYILNQNKAPINSPTFTGNPKAPTPAVDSNDTSVATTAFVRNVLRQYDVMFYQGVVAGGSTGSYGALTPAADKGDVYKVSTAGKIDGIVVQVGDMLICNTDETAAATSSNYTTIAAKWDIIQSNIDGAVTGPSSATDAHVAVFDGTTGKVIKDSGFTIGKSVPSNAVFTDTNKYHKTGSWNGLTYTATAVNSADALAFTIPTGSTSTTVSRGDHTHAISLSETSSATSTVTLYANSIYTLTAGGQSIVFTTPAMRSLGTGANDACAGNDSRLSDSRTPKSHTHGNINNDGTIASTVVTAATGILVYDSSNKIQRATAAQTRSIIGAGTSSLTIGTTSTTAAAGNHTHSLSSESSSATGRVEYIKKVSFTDGVLTLQTAYLKVNSN